MNKKNKKIVNEKLSKILIIIIIIIIFISFILGTAINNFGLFYKGKIISNIGLIIMKEQEVYQDVKVPEFNYYFKIKNFNNEINKYKVNKFLYNLYNENDYIKYEYYEYTKEINKIEK